MAISAYTNNRGFTLIEFLVAVVIMTVGLLGLLQTVNFGIVHNMTNQLRQEAFMLGDDLMNHEKAKPFALISSPVNRTYPNNLRVVNGAFRNYSVVKVNTDTTPQTKSINLMITWHYKSERFVHSIASLVSRFE